jgi:hypothetical protein
MFPRCLSAGLLLLLGGSLAFADTLAQREETLNQQLKETMDKFNNGKGVIDPDKMNAGEQNEYVKLKNELDSLRLWKEAKIPDKLELAKLPAIPADLKGRGDGPSKDSIELAGGDDWRLMGLTTQCMVALPRGWQITEDTYETMVQFPIEVTGSQVELKPEEIIQIKFTMRSTRDFDSYYKSFTDQLKQAFGRDGIEIGPKQALAGGGGYFTISAQNGQRFSVALFIPAKDRSERGYQSMVSASSDRWKSLAPLVEAMMTHWYDHAGNVLAPGFKIDQAVPSGPATTRAH